MRKNYSQPTPPAAATPPSRFITVKATAAELGIGEQTIRRLIAEGELPAVRMGYLLRVPRAALEEYIAENTVTK